MTILNVNDIKEFEDQPIVYNTEQELIDWLKWDLLQQALRNGKEADKNNIITITDEEEKDYNLNIGYVDKISFEIDINFIFNIHSIIDKLNNNEFKSTIIINYIIFAQNVCFKELSSFARIKFNNKLIFNFSKFNKDVTFIGSHFKKKCDFLSVYFYKKADFTFTNLYDKVNISASKLYNAFIFDSSNFYNKSYINFERITFEHSDSIIKIIGNKDNNKIYKLNFSYIDILNKIYIENIKTEEVDFKGSIINGGIINPVNFKVHKFANRESALFLKQQAYARNNVIDALEYKAKEIEKHKEDLIKDWQKNKDFKTFGDIVSIGLSSLYSDNGQNWVRAFICTILFPTVFFTFSFAPYTITLFILIILCFAYPMFHNNNITKYIFYSFITYLIISFLYMFNDNSHLNFIKELFSFLTPTNFNQIVYNNENPSYIHSNNTSYIQLIFKSISYFIGKIAFWYGSVQTVTAFRKFAKGA